MIVAGGMPRILPLGESALVVEFGFEMNDELNQRSIALARYFDENPFPGFIEAVPAYASTSIFFDLPAVRRQFAETDNAYSIVRGFVELGLASQAISKSVPSRSIEIPVLFDADCGPDLETGAANCAMSPKEFIGRFTERTYKVYMIGFLPGFAYMGEVDEQIRLPRKDKPRLSVPKGSVGIAGRQTGIYPLESPGGWQIIGRTNVEMFTPDSETPSLLMAGDEVRFIPI